METLADPPHTTWRPQTRWALPEVMGVPGCDAIATRVDHEALLTLMRGSLAQGHWRVALRRFLMLEAAGFATPSVERSRCEALLAGLSSVERTRMTRAAGQWLQLVRSGR